MTAEAISLMFPHMHSLALLFSSFAFPSSSKFILCLVYFPLFSVLYMIMAVNKSVMASDELLSMRKEAAVAYFMIILLCWHLKFSQHRRTQK